MSRFGTAAQLAQICEGTLVEGETAQQALHHILFDSRKLVYPQNTLFVALQTDRNDGHRFIPQLVEQGVPCFLVQRIPEPAWRGNATYIVVDNTLEALQKWASQTRKNRAAHIVGITGSNGKTIIKEWLFTLLAAKHKVYRSPKSFNSQLGVALSLIQCPPEADWSIIEAGISEPGEMQRLEAMIQPESGIFSNLGSAHEEHFSSTSERLLEKLRLFQNASILVYRRDQELVHEALQAHFHQKLFSWGFHPDAHLRIEAGSDVQHFQVHHAGEIHSLRLPFSDPASVENAFHCVAWLVAMHQASWNEIQERLNLLHAPEMRLQLIPGRNQSTVINDAWIADLDSLRMALDTLAQQTHRNRWVMLSEFQDNLIDPQARYAEVARLLDAYKVHQLLAVGPDFKTYFPGFSGETRYFPSTELLLEALPGLQFHDTAILLKGARIYAFERLVPYFEMKSHETVLEINLSNVLHNVNVYRNRLQPGVKLMAMVKAFSYGSGTAEVANALQYRGVDYLAVAYADEGVELRRAGIRLPIMVMSPEQGSLSTLIEYQLEPEIYSFGMLQTFSNLLRERAGYDAHILKVHIKLNTGMNRLGFDEPDWPALAARLKEEDLMEVVSVFSHLAASGDAIHDPFTRTQIQRFEKGSALLEAALPQPFIRHILNSGGIERHPEAQFDMVRLGIGMYGVSDDEVQEQLLPVGMLKARISQIRNLHPGETVGYSLGGTITQASRIATLPIGYADGFPRKLGHGRFQVKVGGQWAPTKGSICMDMCMIDITGLEGIREGDTVVIFDHADDIRRMARAMETIPYEVLTHISPRVKRVYIQD
jgi:alanine racemase